MTSHEKEGYEVFYLDESSIIMSWNIYHGWFKKGDREVTVPTTLSRKRTNIIGILGRDREFYFQFYTKIDTKSFIRFLKNVRKRYPKTVIFLDNASWHTSKRTLEYVKSTNGDMKLINIPKYTPECNKIEKQWHVIKRGINGRIYNTVEALRQDIRRKIKSSAIKIVQCA